MRKLIGVVAVLVAWAGVADAAGDPVAGRQKAKLCQVCHGKDGIATLLEAPNIAGQKETYLVRALMSFKAGERKNEQMTVIIKQLSDEDIANVAAYYASIKITVEVPP